jgi:hypothetical protein
MMTPTDTLTTLLALHDQVNPGLLCLKPFSQLFGQLSTQTVYALQSVRACK